MLKIVFVTATVALLGIQAALAQQPPALGTVAPGIKRTPLQKFDVPGTNHETVIGIAEIAEYRRRTPYASGAGIGISS